ncbi:MAG: class I SAM-dependent RNA methyltransferase [bacterium]|nr:class I SAM-dependent RNA methyltransferase [bacterium]
MPTALPACPHRPPCPGCPRLFEHGLPERARQVLGELAKRTGHDLPPFVEGPDRGFRMRARLSVRGRAQSPKIGIFQLDSHRIVDIPRCLVHHPLINRVMAAVKNGIRATGTRPYAERPHAGTLRGIQVVVEQSSQTAQLTLVANATDPDSLRPLAEELERELGSALHSLFWNGNAERTNTFLGPHWHSFKGPEAVRETVRGASVFYPPGAFGQSHLELAQRLTEDLAAHVPDGARIAEYHAGCGAIGLGLAHRAARISMNELGEASLRGLELGIAALTPDARARTQGVPGAAADATFMLEDADLAIADPPRKGLDASLLRALCEAPPARLLYVSCDIDSFARDAHALLDAGTLRLGDWSCYALLRHTGHVETLACFDRVAC